MGARKKLSQQKHIVDLLNENVEHNIKRKKEYIINNVDTNEILFLRFIELFIKIPYNIKFEKTGVVYSDDKTPLLIKLLCELNRPTKIINSLIVKVCFAYAPLPTGYELEALEEITNGME